MKLINIITSTDPATRHSSVDAFARAASMKTLLEEAAALDAFRRGEESLYLRVRALFFLYSLHRFHLPERLSEAPSVRAHVPFEGYQHLLHRRFEEAIDEFLGVQEKTGPNDPICSAHAAAYHGLAFRNLADQVRHSVRSTLGNQWMFRMGHPEDHPMRIRPELNRPEPVNGLFPVLREQTPVRMDLSHSGWSDIFFLGMEYPEGARVLNVSVDLGVHGRDAAPQPPVEAWLRVMDRPVLRLASVDLGCAAEMGDLDEVFDFARDYLGLLKAALIAAGLVPPGLEGSGQRLSQLLEKMVGSGRGLELVSNVNGIPKGSRLAVSTNLLGALIAVCMRATGQAKSLTGPLEESERRLVAARAILGEWIGGSGGGWQDSGGVWPGIKLIQGEQAQPGDVEYGVSRGRLLPAHKILGIDEVSDAARKRLQESLVLVHGGMAQNVGPILEMVTEKYLLRCEAEWEGRKEAGAILDEIVASLKKGAIRDLGDATTRNFFGPVQTIIPWASNYYTEALVDEVRTQFGKQFWGFLMLGGMSGGGMGLLFDPEAKERGKALLLETMSKLKRELNHSLPFAMDPVVYDFSINEHGTWCTWIDGQEALYPAEYYLHQVPSLLRQDPRSLTAQQRSELAKFADASRAKTELAGVMPRLFDRLLPSQGEGGEGSQSLEQLLAENGFDRVQHEQVREDLKSGRIGLAQNRLPANTSIEDVQPEDVWDVRSETSPQVEEQKNADLGLEAMRNGQVAVISLAAGVGSRWTQGAGVVKALHPFAKLHGRHRTFLEVHLAKSRQRGRECGRFFPHIFTTSYLTHEPIRSWLALKNQYEYEGELVLSPGRAIGLRMIPMTRDLQFAWEESPQQQLDEQKQKMRERIHAALIDWARTQGEGSDYTDNVPSQCLHPVGHWFEFPNLLRNGVLADLLDRHPDLQYLMMHNIDTLGADVDPAVLGLHIKNGNVLSFEVVERRIEDRGGGLARVDGSVRLVEGLAMPREEAEFRLSYYNSMTTWMHLDQTLSLFGITRSDLRDETKVMEGVRHLAQRMPTYVTLKEVKKRWGHGQEDVFPVAQFEKLWSDMTALPKANCSFFVVPRMRGQQLKDQAQLDGWLRDGSAAYVAARCVWA